MRIFLRKNAVLENEGTSTDGIVQADGVGIHGNPYDMVTNKKQKYLWHVSKG